MTIWHFKHKTKITYAPNISNSLSLSRSHTLIGLSWCLLYFCCMLCCVFVVFYFISIQLFVSTVRCGFMLALPQFMGTTQSTSLEMSVRLVIGSRRRCLPKYCSLSTTTLHSTVHSSHEQTAVCYAGMDDVRLTTTLNAFCVCELSIVCLYATFFFSH